MQRFDNFCLIRLLQKHLQSAISFASQTFALANARCSNNHSHLTVFKWPVLAQSLCRAGKASRRITPVDLRKSNNSVIAASQEYVSMQIQSSTENKVAAKNSSHCTLVPRPFPSQQRQASERACITFSKISKHIQDQLIKMLEFFPLVSCTTILT